MSGTAPSFDVETILRMKVASDRRLIEVHESLTAEAIRVAEVLVRERDQARDLAARLMEGYAELRDALDEIVAVRNDPTSRWLAAVLRGSNP